MTARGILFGAPMVRAILAGTKTQTRRLLKPRPPSVDDVRLASGSDYSIFTDHHLPGIFRVAGPVWAVRERMDSEPEWRCPYGVPGDRLWVRETWSQCARGVYPCPPCWYRADYGAYDDPAREQLHHQRGCTGNQGDCFACVAEREGKFVWRPSIFMPRWASRITLEVTDVRVERLNAISEQDAKAEGVARDDLECDHKRLSCDDIGCLGTTYRSAFAGLWDTINGKHAPWSSNPWVWVVNFRRVQ